MRVYCEAGRATERGRELAAADAGCDDVSTVSDAAATRNVQSMCVDLWILFDVQ